jgi:hypothetical protein
MSYYLSYYCCYWYWRWTAPSSGFWRMMKNDGVVGVERRKNKHGWMGLLFFTLVQATRSDVPFFFLLILRFRWVTSLHDWISLYGCFGPMIRMWDWFRTWKIRIRSKGRWCWGIRRRIGITFGILFRRIRTWLRNRRWIRCGGCCQW